MPFIIYIEYIIKPSMILTLDIMMKGGGERGMEILWISENLGPPAR
jgi:hypothetical protein